MQVAAPAARKHARRMRKAATSNEAKLWKLLRDRQLEAMKFRRQVAIGSYIVDFVCFRFRLIVEANGPLHEDDEERDAWLRSQGFRISRFPNAMIALNHRQVLADIRRAIEVPGEFGVTPHPTPYGGHLLPQGEKDT
jgi:very-short-patch-repair endonuclease